MPSLSPLLLQAFIKDALTLGVGSTEALDVFRAAGGAIRTQTFLDAFRAVGQIPINARGIAALSSSSPIPDQYIVQGYENQAKKYIYHMAVGMEGDFNGTGNPFHVTIGSNQKMSAARLKKIAQKQAETRMEGYTVNVTTVSITSVLGRPD
jgi:hypothetical protein